MTHSGSRHHRHGHHDHGHHDHGHHDHGHHDHGHHDHGHHDHAGGEPAAPGLGALAPGGGRGKTLFFDAFSGVAGDMTIAALVDLGVPVEFVRETLSKLPIQGLDVTIERTFAGAIGASRLKVHAPERQPHRTFGDIDAMLLAADLNDETRRHARAIFRTLAEAEASVHRVPISDVHFHEVGAVDAIADIVGAAACFAYLGATVESSPLPMGHGFVDCAHGRLPLPAPGTLACLAGVPTYAAGVEAELVTPTGAAIVRTMATRFVRWPDLTVERVGWGAGSRVLPDRPNALRVVLGSAEPASSDAHVLLEANVDDLTGEVAAYAIDTLLKSGALDAWATPLTMKKGRPGLMLCAIAPESAATRVAETLLRETTTLGVRTRSVGRFERPRRIVAVATRFGEIRVKVAEGPFGPPNVKPEFDDCAAAAARHGVPLRQVMQEALAQAVSLVNPGDPG